MLMGGHGTISVAANILPKTMSQLCSFALDGHVGKARAINTQLIPLFNVLSIDTNPIPIKFVMSNFGLMLNVLRLPLVPLSEDLHCEVKSILHQIAEYLPELSALAHDT